MQQGWTLASKLNECAWWYEGCLDIRNSFIPLVLPQRVFIAHKTWGHADMCPLPRATKLSSPNIRAALQTQGMRMKIRGKFRYQKLIHSFDLTPRVFIAHKTWETCMDTCTFWATELSLPNIRANLLEGHLKMSQSNQNIREGKKEPLTGTRSATDGWC